MKTDWNRNWDWIDTILVVLGIGIGILVTLIAVIATEVL